MLISLVGWVAAHVNAHRRARRWTLGWRREEEGLVRLRLGGDGCSIEEYYIDPSLFL